MNFIILLSAGIAAGVAAGLGVGGGAILIPALTIFLGMEQKTAQGINLLYFLPTAAVAVITHIKHKRIDRDLVKGLVFYGLIGAGLGAFLAMAAEQERLRKMFGYFLLAVGLWEIMGKKPEDKKQEET